MADGRNHLISFNEVDIKFKDNSNEALVTSQNKEPRNNTVQDNRCWSFKFEACWRRDEFTAWHRTLPCKHDKKLLL
jgi:hypothetical protein